MKHPSLAILGFLTLTALSGCGDGEGFATLEEEAYFGITSGDVSIQSYYPQDSVIRLAANGTTTFGVNLVGGGDEDVIYSYRLDGETLGAGSSPFYNLSGTLVSAGEHSFSIEASNGSATDEHTFRIIRNNPPSLSNQSPETNTYTFDCSSDTLLFNVAFTDLDADPVSVEWERNEIPLDSSVLVDTDEERSRALLEMDCSAPINDTITAKVSDGIDITEQTWTVLDPTSGASSVVGNSAIVFDPVSYDFSFVQAYTGSETTTITATNSTSMPIYISSFGSLGTHYSKVSDNCPRSPTAFEAGASCTITISFSPQGPGLLPASLTVSYASTVGGEALQSVLGLSGTGVSPLTFDGLQSISDIYHNRVTLNWDASATAASFIVFQVSGSSLVYNRTIVNSGGSVTSVEVDELSPSTAYTFRVKATDVFGNQDSNTADSNTTTLANKSPLLGALTASTFYSGEAITTLDAQDANTNSDFDEDYDALTYTCRYDKSINGTVGTGLGACTALVNEGGGNPSFSSTAGVFGNWKPLHAEIGNTYEFEIVATDPYGASSKAVFSGTINQGTPDQPTISGISSARSSSNTPTVTGTGTANLTVVLYSDNTCSTQVGSGSVDGAGNFSIQVTVPENGSYTIHGKTVNAINNYSACSATSVSFTEDSTAPSPLTLSGTTPVSPANVASPTVDGVTETGVDVYVYTNNDCTGQVGTLSAAANTTGNFSISVAAAADSANTFYVVAVDDVGNTTSCSANSVSYTHYSIANNVGWFKSRDTDDVADPSRVNPDADVALRWYDGRFDATTFSFTANNSFITVKKAGHYLLALTVPVSKDSKNDGVRVASRFTIYINGAPGDAGAYQVTGALAEATYIRDSDGHAESSAHMTIITPALSVDDEIYAIAYKGGNTSNASAESSFVEFSNVASLYAEHIDPASRTVFGAYATTNTDGSGELNNNSNDIDSDGQRFGHELKWNVNDFSSFNTAGYTHANLGSRITLDGAGYYFVTVNLPMTSTGQRASPTVVVEVLGEATEIQGRATHSYMRAATDAGNSGNNRTSVQWTGIVQTTTTNRELTVRTFRDSTYTGVTNSVTIPGGESASIFIEKLDLSTRAFQAYATTLGGSTEWNPSSLAQIDWDTTNGFKDATYFSHDNATNEQQITFAQGGDYLLIYNDALQSVQKTTSGSKRVNPKVMLYKGATAVTGAEVKNHYMRLHQHYHSSGTMTYFLQGVQASDVYTLRVVGEADTSKSVIVVDPAQLTIIKKD
ncbi:fibronectin type III domain-containing protein [Pseudobacteriovorax antillogorgiicola]|uniref:Fibronectin type-III domain-containing protein n=1 Tax=Pseudobacteriovorax antillogorgiicola TaxID=1513793 RepID=A0A1Y6CGN7_9BACT|nr:fibronectin type III domain-containing protein [Pseudobacteriovorax antillogorgiicola]TCS46931.1 hypothetical protein EDD56_12226 [Pseudobacteriovorax antillogorgiicola]SMF64315.1 hypothetical protein SAMN06296036_12226 [Pseudobacteriovorax antillogorgiicola]